MSETAAASYRSGSRRDAAAGRGAGALWLARLRLSDYRCYPSAELEVDGRPVVLAGPNGAGKTNLLEAISLLAPGRGLRGARLDEIARRDAAGPPGTWSVAARVMTPQGPRELGTGWAGANDGAANNEAADSGNGENGENGANGANGESRERRVIKIDGAFARGQQALAEVLRVTWLTPRMDGLFRDGPGPRRRFLDRMVTGFDAGHAGRLAAYEQALRQRARLLRSGNGDPAWLSALEDAMARHGVAVAAARRALVADLSRACQLGVGPFPRARLALAGDVDGWLERRSALLVEDELRTRLAAQRGVDAESGGAAVGPHRSDLLVGALDGEKTGEKTGELGAALDGGRPAGQGSTGEQKALLLSIVLSHARLIALARGNAPLLLLDEVAAHLDRARRRALFEEILALGAQAWLTGTEPELFAELGRAAQHLAVAGGTLAARA